jgi:Short-chain dehydrogenases of various substrate specificities
MIIVATGGTSGIGKALAEKLREEGNTVIILARSAEDGEFSFKADVSDSERVRIVFKEIYERFGRIDVLVNNAGYGMSGATEYISEKDAKVIFGANFFGALFCSQAALGYMKAGARIIDVGSLSAISPIPFRSLYNSSKAALHMLSVSMRTETEPFGIDVTEILLGDTATNFASRRIMFKENGRYSDASDKVDDFMAGRGNDKKTPLDAAVKKIVKIIYKKKTKAYYIFGIKYKIAYLLNSFFPEFVRKTVYKIMTK